MAERIADKIVVAPVVRIPSSPALQHTTLKHILPKLSKKFQETVRSDKFLRVGRPGRRDWFYRIMEIVPNDPGVIVTSATQIEIAPRYRDLESVFTFRVAHSYPSDEGRGLVRMEPSQMHLLGIDRAEYMAVWAEGSERRLGVRVLPLHSRDSGLPILRMDQITRENLKVKEGQFVECQVINKQIAITVTFRPVEEKVTLLVSPTILKDRLTYASVTQGQVFHLKGYVRKIPPPTYPRIKPFSRIETTRIIVDATEPKGIVVIDKKTEVQIEKVARSG
ncbi:MAG: hypothetical protein ACFFFG_01480 [Candidatus Thorarchaeota archaeon]